MMRPKKLEHLSDASFLGKLLVLPANVRLDWKVIASYAHFSLFGLVISNEENKFLWDGHQHVSKSCGRKQPGRVATSFKSFY